MQQSQATMLAELERMLDQRADDKLRTEIAVGLAMLISLSAALYLFHCFFLVMNGGLRETRRHLKAMTEGDLTTAPSPWGRDEAAALMLDLRDMQHALRHMVSSVRAATASASTCGLGYTTVLRSVTFTPCIMVRRSVATAWA